LQLFSNDETQQTMNRYPLVLIPIILFVTLVGSVNAQQSAIYRDQDADLKEGLELFHKAQYGAAQLRFSEYLGRTDRQEATSRADAAFYHAMCALRLDHDNGESLVENFLEKYPESSKANLARFEMGKVLFVNKKFKRASAWLQEVKIQKLGAEYHTEYQFYSGYCFIVDKAYKKAQPLLEQVMNTEGVFKEAATYYYFYTVYQDKDYDKALKGFLGLQSSKDFGSSSKYYVVQI
jgi:tetratricopeptide (TPR) repeat protein